MEWLQALLESSTTPALTAFLLGLLTAVSPCPLATNIAAIGFIGNKFNPSKLHNIISCISTYYKFADFY